MELVVSLTVIVLAALAVLDLINEEINVGNGVADLLACAVIVNSHFQIACAKIECVLRYLIVVEVGHYLGIGVLSLGVRGLPKEIYH